MPSGVHRPCTGLRPPSTEGETRSSAPAPAPGVGRATARRQWLASRAEPLAFMNVRYTDHDVILARAGDSGLHTSNPRGGNFATNLTVSIANDPGDGAPRLDLHRREVPRGDLPLLHLASGGFQRGCAVRAGDRARDARRGVALPGDPRRRSQRGARDLAELRTSRAHVRCGFAPPATHSTNPSSPSGLRADGKSGALRRPRAVGRGSCGRGA